MPIRVKRIYDPPDRSDGVRILVDRLWPRGLSKDRAQIDDWLKDIAPSDELRKWFGHAPARWPEFRRRYKAELAEKSDLLKTLRARVQAETVTLLYAARDTERNNAAVLAEVLRAP
jgi:uncharacterized protein YeaO (DUF488 family)